MVNPYMPQPEPQETTPEDALADLFEVPQPEDNDMRIDHLIAASEEEDVSDLLSVSMDDIMGVDEAYEPLPPARTQQPQRVIVRRVPTPGLPQLGGQR